MLTVHQLSKSYPLVTLFKDVTFSLNSGERAGLVGPNGSGKTTLLRCIAGKETPSSGAVAFMPGVRVGHLEISPDSEGPDDTLPMETLTIADALRDERAEAAVEVERLAEAVTAAAGANESAARVASAAVFAYQAALDRLEALGGYPDPSHSQALLASLGLQRFPLSTPVRHLSGGQKTRLGLARVLFSDPNLLLLDEPTNHLDLAMLTWLEDWLRDFRGAALIVSHDRTFLDHTVTKTLFMDERARAVREHPGNYTAFLEQRLAEQGRQWSQWRDQQAEIRRMKQDIARTMEQARSVERSTTPRQPGVRRYAKKVARKGKARDKKLDRYLESDERVEKPERSWEMKLDFAAAPISGQDVLVLEMLAVGYDGRPLLSNLNSVVRQGQRIALVGENGSGKTTLLKTVAGRLEPVKGRVSLGANVRAGYLAQEQEWLEPESTPLETIRAAAPFNETEARAFLHYFLFTGDESLILNRLLSLGERARLMLAVLVAQGSNLLLLDEPLNHLDIPSRTKFEQALASFEGTTLVVVHDRYFIRGFASEVWAVEGGGLKVYFDMDELRAESNEK